MPSPQDTEQRDLHPVHNWQHRCEHECVRCSREEMQQSEAIAGTSYMVLHVDSAQEAASVAGMLPSAQRRWENTTLGCESKVPVQWHVGSDKSNQQVTRPCAATTTTNNHASCTGDGCRTVQPSSRNHNPDNTHAVHSTSKQTLLHRHQAPTTALHESDRGCDGAEVTSQLTLHSTPSHTCTHTHTHTHAHIHKHAHTYTHIHKHAHTHTHNTTHAHEQESCEA